MLPIDVLLTETELADGLVAALEQRFLPEKFFYWFPLSVKAWLALCDGAPPYRNFSRSYQLVARHADEIAAAVGDLPVEVVGLGAGQGDKDALLLGAFSGRAGNAAVRYRPVDSSQALLEIATARALAAGISARGFKADLDSGRTFEALASLAEETRLLLVLGNTLGGFDPPEFLKRLRSLLRPRDFLLLDGEIFSAADTMPGYDNPVNRRFAFAPLASLGVEEGRDGELVFESGADPRVPGLHFVSKHFRATRKLEIPVAGGRVALEAGETLPMSRSYKYERETLPRMLAEFGGLRIEREMTGDDARFLLVLARAA